MKRNIFLSISLLLIVLMLSACVSNESNNEKISTTTDVEQTNASSLGKTYAFKLGHNTQETHLFHKTSEVFAEKLEELSDGRMTLSLFPASQLGTEADMTSQVENGALDFAFITNAYMSTREESLNSWFMPYVFNDISAALEMAKTEEAQALLDSISTQGFKGLGFVFAGNRHVLMKQGFAEDPNAVSGKKVRIIGSPSIQTYWETIGAQPTSMPLSEVYTSLQTGVIDGMDIDLDALVAEKYYEQANYLTLTNHFAFPTVAIVSDATFNKLSAEDKAIVEEAMAVAIAWGAEEVIKRESSNLETVKAEGVEVLENPNTDTYETFAQTVHDQYESKNELIAKFLEKAKSLQ
ncbi:MAG: TRAP transporter substrate-binding protein [Solibacillus sp.]